MVRFKISILLLLVLTSCISEKATPQNYQMVESPGEETVYPGATWAATQPENFGYSQEKLKAVKSYFEDIDGEVFLVIQNGYVIISWGDVSKPIQNRSIRKSYLNALLGMEYDKGNLSLNASLADLAIDDVKGLTDTEKQATIQNLLTSASGIYHPAAFESSEQADLRPQRGSRKPGEFFYYNNWDFNASGHIYTKLSGTPIFEGMQESIASVLEMEDFRLEDMKYEFEKPASNFPAYRMNTSARDDARLGYLFLQKGKWKDQQVISEEWVDKSTKVQIKTPAHRYYDYGLLWWVDDKNNMFMARGNSGQYIAVSPELNMVFVFRADPGGIFKKWSGKRVKPQESFALIGKVLGSKDVTNSEETSSN